VRLKGKACLVTAAGQGIGRATAERFAAEGGEVLATDVNPTLLASASRMETRKLDVTDPAAIDRFFDEAGPFDVIFNCAGYVHQGTILDCSEEDWRCSFELNVTSMFRVTKAALPAMLDRGAGSIINMSSVASSIKGTPNRFAYGSTKAAVIGLTKSIAADYAGRGIRCNAICPGTVETPSLAGRMAALPGELEKVRESFIARQPMGRLGSPREIADLAVYLASDESAFTTGSICVIDGGWSV
jgi:2-keto-3-deoxy-L-fuconate dehydrogenase